MVLIDETDTERKNFTETKFKELLWNVCDDLLVSLNLLETYQEPSRSRTSKCYEMTFSSHDYSFSRDDALKLQHSIRSVVGDCLNVIVR